MSKHILDHSDGSEGSDRAAKEFARTEREQGDETLSRKAKAMQKAPHEPSDEESGRVGEFVKRDRAGE